MGSICRLVTRGLLSLGLLLAFWTSSAPAQTTAEAWVTLTRADLTSMHETLLKNHPGPVDPLNPGYRRWLDDGYREALALADSVKNLDGLMAVLSFYTSGFDDGHLAWGPVFSRTGSLWPGVIVSLRDGRFLVNHVAPWAAAETEGLVPGAEVLACDGRDMHDRLVDDVMKFQQGIPSLEASRVRLAPRILIEDYNPFVDHPDTCRIREAGSAEVQEIDLDWRWIVRGRLDSLVAAAAYGSGVDDYRILHPADDVAWITIPSFNETVGDNRSGLERIVAGMPEVRRAGLIVFDVRGNGGGSSAWAHRILAPVFGEEYMDEVETKVEGHEYVEWRASEGNADFVEQNTLPRYEPGSEGYDWLTRLIATLREGVESGQELVGSTSDEGSQPEESTAAITGQPLAERVILLTDGWCASACLDFADLLLAIPGVRHAGSPTYADAVYIDNRGIFLPSRVGWFTFSMKVYRNRPRGQNEPYEPDLEYTGEDWELGALQEWLLRVAR